jgi:hypothetical protein
MLRITTLRGERDATLRLEGKLAQEWVREAEKEWEALAAKCSATSNPHRPYQCKLFSVTYNRTSS